MTQMLSDEYQHMAANSVSHAAFMCQEMFREMISEHSRPCVLFKPKLSLDGNSWIACFGENLQEGVVGTGDSPALAMSDFDRAWYAKKQ